MRLLARMIVVTAMMVASPPAAASVAQSTMRLQPPPALLAASVAEAVQRFDIPADWIWAVIRVESGGDTHAVSPAGATGLMQVMPATGAAVRLRYGLGSEPFEAHDNILGDAAYLREMRDRYGDPVAMLAAYNAGPGRYDEYLEHGRPLPAETLVYVQQLAPIIGGSIALRTATTVLPDPFAWRRAALFVRTAIVTDMTKASRSGDDPVAPVSPVENQPDRSSANSATTNAPPSDLHVDELFVRRPDVGRPR